MKKAIKPSEEIFEGLTQVQRSNFKLLISSVSGGLDIGFSVIALSIGMAFLLPILGADLAEFAALILYPIGYLFVVFGRSELFTEHTVTVILPFLEGVISLRKLLEVWVITLIGNLIGAVFFALGFFFLKPVAPAGTGEALSTLATHLLEVPWWTMVVSGVFCGWLMALIAWTKNSPRDSITILVLTYMIALLIGAVPLHHSVVGSLELFSAMTFGAPIGIGQYLTFLGLAFSGNAIGGVVFVSLFKWSHARPEEGV